MDTRTASLGSVIIIVYKFKATSRAKELCVELFYDMKFKHTLPALRKQAKLYLHIVSSVIDGELGCVTAYLILLIKRKDCLGH